MNKRKDLKILISSATMDTELYLNFFKDYKCEVVYIEGRTYPIDILYLKEPSSNYIQTALSVVLIIEKNFKSRGDILVFLTGAEDIFDFINGFNQLKDGNIIIR